MGRLLTFMRSVWFFRIILSLFFISSAWIALASIYPMAFDEEFHYGLVQIYAGSWLPYGITHTSDMAQYGAATADASYLFHYLMSFPYRILDAVGLANDTIIIALRFINIAFVIVALAIFRRAFLDAGVGRATTHVALALVATIPVFTVLAAHINYDNLLLPIIAWCVLLIVHLTKQAYAGKPLRLRESLLLAFAVLIGMSVKYAFLPLALAMFVWLLWLVVVSYRKHKQTISSQLASYKTEWRTASKRARRLAIGLAVISVFFASHYVTNGLSYGNPIPTCEQVFSETECQAYGPWYRNQLLVAMKPASFQPVTYPEYLATEWFPGMTQRLTFAVAGKTNDFQTELPFPALVISYVSLAVVGMVAFTIQLIRRRSSWFMMFAGLLTLIYAGVLSVKLYGSYVSTAEPIAINGRYLLPLLPLLTVAFIQALRNILAPVSSRILAAVTALVFAWLIVCGAGAITYIVLAHEHWFWNGFAQSTHSALQAFFERIVLPYRY